MIQQTTRFLIVRAWGDKLLDTDIVNTTNQQVDRDQSSVTSVKFHKLFNSLSNKENQDLWNTTAVKKNSISSLNQPGDFRVPVKPKNGIIIWPFESTSKNPHLDSKDYKNFPSEKNIEEKKISELTLPRCQSTKNCQNTKSASISKSSKNNLHLGCLKAGSESNLFRLKSKSIHKSLLKGLKLFGQHKQIKLKKYELSICKVNWLNSNIFYRINYLAQNLKDQKAMKNSKRTDKRQSLAKMVDLSSALMNSRHDMKYVVIFMINI